MEILIKDIDRYTVLPAGARYKSRHCCVLHYGTRDREVQYAAYSHIRNVPLNTQTRRAQGSSLPGYTGSHRRAPP